MLRAFLRHLLPQNARPVGRERRRAPSPRKAPRTGRPFCPLLEALEDRLAPAVLTWDGGGGDNNWTTAANWVGNVAPTAGDDLAFAGNVQLTSNNSFAAGTAFSSITFKNGGFDLTGNAVTLTSAGASKGITSSGGANAIDFGVTSAANPLIITAAMRQLTLNGPISGSGLTKQGYGVLTLSGANTFAGAVTVQQGILVAASNGALGTTAGSTTVTAGATLALKGGISSADAVFLAGQGAGGIFGHGALVNVEGINTLTGAVTATAPAVIVSGPAFDLLTLSGPVNNGGFNLTVDTAADGVVTISGVISGGGGLIKQGVGILTLSGPSTFTGAVMVQQGVLVAASNGALGTSAGGTTVAGNATLALKGGISSAEAISLAGTGVGGGNGSGALVNLDGNNSLSGALTLTAATTLLLPAGLLTLSGPVNSGGFDLTVTGAGNTTIGGVISGGGSLTMWGAGTLILAGANTYTGYTAVESGTLLVNGSTPAQSLVEGNGGTLGGTGMIMGGVDVSGGTLGPGSPAANPGALAIGALDMDGASFVVQLNGAGAGQFDQLTVTGPIAISAFLSVTLGAGFQPAAGSSFTIIKNDGSDPVSGNFLGLSQGAGLMISGTLFVISYTGGDGNDVVLTALPSGTRVWDGGGGDNNWTTAANWVGNVAPSAGANLVFGGNVQQTSNNNFAAGTAFRSITFTNGGFTLTGNAVTLTGAGSDITNTSGANRITLQGVTAAANPLIITSSVGTLTLSGPVNDGGGVTVAGSGNTVINGVISGGGGLTKQGAGTLTLWGANTYTGATAVQGGYLVVANNAALGSTAGGTTVTAGGTLVLPFGISTAEAVSLAGAGVGGAGALRSNGSNTLSGPLTATAAATIVSAELQTLLTLSGPVNNGGFNLAVECGAGDTTISGVISGSGGLTVLGSGTLTLSGANTYTGATTVRGGTLVAANSGALGSSAGSTTVTGGATLALQGGITIAEAISLATTGIYGNGALVNLSGNNTLSGPITVTAAATIASNAGLLTLSGPVNNGGFGLTFICSGGNATIGGAISGGGGLTLGLAGGPGGTLTLSGANTYTGATTVNAGTLLVNGSTAAASAVTVNQGATLGGTGTVMGPVSAIAGILSPGAGSGMPGTLSTGNLTLTQVGTSYTSLDVELNGTNSSPGQCSQVNVTGTVNLGGATLVATLGPGFVPAVGTSYTIVNNDGADPVVGTFRGLAEGATVTIDGRLFTISYKGGDGNDVVLTEVT
jgi:autotransporter-associated beta strand protein